MMSHPRIYKNPALTVRDVLNIIIIYRWREYSYHNTPSELKPYLLPRFKVNQWTLDTVKAPLGRYVGDRNKYPELKKLLDTMRQAPMIEGEQQIIDDLKVRMCQLADTIDNKEKYKVVPLEFYVAIGRLAA